MLSPFFKESSNHSFLSMLKTDFAHYLQRKIPAFVTVFLSASCQRLSYKVSFLSSVSIKSMSSRSSSTPNYGIVIYKYLLDVFSTNALRFIFICWLFQQNKID